MTSISRPHEPHLDIFISHASEDREEVASPLAAALTARGYSVWISNHEIVLGNSLPWKINDGLKSCRFGVAILSPVYFQKHWTMKELAAFTSRGETEQRDIIVPILHGISRERLTSEYPLWSPLVSETWAGDPGATAASIAKAVGAPLAVPPRQLDALALMITSRDLDLEARQAALVAGAGDVTKVIVGVWSMVQRFHQETKSLPDSRKRARASMLVGSLAVPLRNLDSKTDQMESAASGYLETLRTVLVLADAIRGVDRDSLVKLNAVYSGGVAATYSHLVELFTLKRAETVSFPKRHPDLTRALDHVGDDLARLSRAFEALVDFCVSEFPERVRRILEK
jgi:hypothetical protein